MNSVFSHKRFSSICPLESGLSLLHDIQVFPRAVLQTTGGHGPTETWVVSGDVCVVCREAYFQKWNVLKDHESLVSIPS